MFTYRLCISCLNGSNRMDVVYTSKYINIPTTLELLFESSTHTLTVCVTSGVQGVSKRAPTALIDRCCVQAARLVEPVGLLPCVSRSLKTSSNWFLP